MVNKQPKNLVRLHKSLEKRFSAKITPFDEGGAVSAVRRGDLQRAVTPHASQMNSIVEKPAVNTSVYARVFHP
jgi:hypothetical protein